MKKINPCIMPLAGSIVLILLYIISIQFRGITSLPEYEFAIVLRKVFPGISGTVLPKLPSAAATLLTAALIWFTAFRMKMLHPWVAPVMFLCFPPVWWFGTSISPVPLMVLMITLAVAGLFSTRKNKGAGSKVAGIIAGVIGTLGAAFFVQSRLFTWSAALLALMPVLCLALAIRLEKLDDRDLAAKKFNRWAIVFAVTVISIIILLLIPQICHIFKVNLSEKFKIFYFGKALFRPALALLIPLLWLYMVKEAKKSFEKLALIMIALGFILLVLPATLPWDRITGTLQPEKLQQVKDELCSNNSTIFADDSSAPVLSYALDLPVTETGWGPGCIHPGQLSEKITGSLPNGDVIVASCDGELERFIPRSRMIKYTISTSCKLYLFPGDKK